MVILGSLWKIRKRNLFKCERFWRRMSQFLILELVDMYHANGTGQAASRMYFECFPYRHQRSRVLLGKLHCGLREARIFQVSSPIGLECITRTRSIQKAVLREYEKNQQNPLKEELVLDVYRVYLSSVRRKRKCKEYKHCARPVIPNALHSHTGVGKNCLWILFSNEK